MTTKLDSFSSSIDQKMQINTERIDAVNELVNTKLSTIQAANNESLEKMRKTVDEELSKTITERLTVSFSQVKNQLQLVQEGLQSVGKLAGDVGDVRKMLSNVKTRGIVGEVQLQAILEQLMSKEQYVTNAAIRGGHVEFAVKIPTEDNQTVLLPIDAKFPGETYQHLVEAQQDMDPERIKAATQELIIRVKNEAKSVSEKYIDVPKTTNFALLFLPFEGLYAEVVNKPGLLVELQNKYSIVVAGPSTMAAILNSLQMSYESFAIQKKSDEIYQVLQSVKSEFAKYIDQLEKVKKNLHQADNELEKLMSTRTNMMQRKLNTITELELTNGSANVK